MKLQRIPIERKLVTVHPDKIHSLLGVPPSEDDPHTLNLIEFYISESLKIMSPQGGAVSLPAIPSDSREEIATDGVRFGTGRIIGNMLRGSKEYIFFIATAGPGPEELSASLINDGQYLDGYIVDLIGSSLVESVANQLQERIMELADQKGLKITNRYSPGHCSWDVNEQQKLFSQFPSGFCGITLSDSSLMTPIKSVSGVIGMGDSVSFREYTCEICSLKGCIFRTPRILSPETG